MSKIEQLIQEIEEYIDTCQFQPLSKTKIVVNKEELEELLVELRLRVPDEIKKYQKIISNQEAIISDARKQAANIIDEATLQGNNILDDATSQSNQMLADADAQTRERVDNHEIMQQVYEQAQQILDNAQAQAQEILNRAEEDAASIRLGSMQYTDDMLRSLQTIINHAIETSQSQFDGFLNALHSNYNIVESNRNELAIGLGQEDDSQQIETEDSANE